MTATSISTGEDLVSIAVSASAASLRLVVAGEVDSSSAPALRTAVDDAFAAGVSELVVDLGAVTFLDSAGLCVLAGAHRRAEEECVRLRVLACNRAVIRPLQITGLWELLAVEQVEPGAGSAA
ncbi:STAS domain-containing protein [Geodermatophilus sabuli]|uniref:Anti-sigma factor antagonist n=1 Tax=Geodermatophilus sabuli TaxID=1564158 RepID=A0A285EF52_9ACTN|nr:STAS domain-containing protein [Geodermatophilus sabuli]MBB3086586.1 anti-sigma B factor antagonist [Geodermatophilus sabuli]SNX97762.1 anti-anti-sigma factor [Geodermatophilus sabuli]